MTQPLPLSVILATTEPWPDLANCLAVLEPQVEALGGEIIVGDGHGGARDPVRSRASSCIRWIVEPGASVFALRARAAEVARGDIIALTEDHCIVGPDWCAEVLRAFELHPEAAAVTGPVWNGSEEHLIDQANYLHTFVTTRSGAGSKGRAPPIANVAFRRSELPAGSLPAGWIALELTPRLDAEGRFAWHQPMAVTHVQSHSFWRTLLSHFDNGRTTSGLETGSRKHVQRPWVLYRAVAEALRNESDSVYRSRMRRSLPLVFLLSCCHSAGEIAGLLTGPGKSPARLR